MTVWLCVNLPGCVHALICVLVCSFVCLLARFPPRVCMSVSLCVSLSVCVYANVCVVV